MTNFTKSYIGKGTKVQNLDIVRVSISEDKLMELMENELVEYDGKNYLIFEVAALTEKDNYGRTHTAYISKREEAPTPVKAKKSAKK
jgi:hypothetical protein